LFGPLIATGALAIASLHPQFLLTALTVNPDALLNVVGAFMWWQVARATTSHRPTAALIFVLAAALLAPFVKRSGLLVSGIGLLWAIGFLAPRLRLTRRVMMTAM